MCECLATLCVRYVFTEECLEVVVNEHLAEVKYQVFYHAFVSIESMMSFWNLNVQFFSHFLYDYSLIL